MDAKGHARKESGQTVVTVPPRLEHNTAHRGSHLSFSQPESLTLISGIFSIPGLLHLVQLDQPFQQHHSAGGTYPEQ